MDFIFSLLAYRGSFHLLPCVAVNSNVSYQQYISYLYSNLGIRMYYDGILSFCSQRGHHLYDGFALNGLINV